VVLKNQKFHVIEEVRNACFSVQELLRYVSKQGRYDYIDDNSKCVIALLDRCKQVLQLLDTCREKSDYFELGFIYGLSLVQLMSTTDHDRIQLMMFVFASSGGIDTRTEAEKSEIATFFQEQVGLFYSNEVADTYKAFQVVRNGIALQDSSDEVFQNWKHPLLLTGPLESKPRRRCNNWLPRLLMSPMLIFYPQDAWSSLKAASQKVAEEAREAGSLTALFANLLMESNQFQMAARVCCIALMKSDDYRIRSIMFDCINRFYSDETRTGDAKYQFYISLFFQDDNVVRELVDEYCMKISIQTDSKSICMYNTIVRILCQVKENYKLIQSGNR
jgi:hypothetical protein